MATKKKATTRRHNWKREVHAIKKELADAEAMLRMYRKRLEDRTSRAGRIEELEAQCVRDTRRADECWKRAVNAERLHAELSASFDQLRRAIGVPVAWRVRAPDAERARLFAYYNAARKYADACGVDTVSLYAVGRID